MATTVVRFPQMRLHQVATAGRGPVARGVIVWLGVTGKNEARLLRESQQAPPKDK